MDPKCLLVSERSQTWRATEYEIAFIWYLETNGEQRVSLSQIYGDELFGVELSNDMTLNSCQEYVLLCWTKYAQMHIKKMNML